MGPNRRTVLTGLGAGVLLSGLSPGPLIRRARATTCGGLTTSSTLNGPYKVLEIFLAGAVSHQETLWMTGSTGPGWSMHDTPSAWSTLPVSHRNGIQLFDGSNNPTGVFLGGMCHPLSPNLNPANNPWRAATRVVALGHGQPAHEAAIPFALGGHPLGRPARAGLGAAIGRRAAGCGTTPASFVLHGGNRGVARHALATGLHGSDHRPIELSLGSKGERLVAQLVARGDETYRAGVLDVYGARYRQRLQRASSAVRSIGFADHDAARSQLGGAGDWASDLQKLINPPLPNSPSYPLDYDQTYTWANGIPTANGYISRAIHLASGLLGDAALNAQHVCVIDDGVGDAVNYDSHAAQHTDMEDAFRRQAGNLWLVLSAVTAAWPGGPPSDTLIVIHTEFGRDRVYATGTEHHAAGYAAMLIGGPVVPGVGGSMTGLATDTVDHGTPGPADLHAAIQYAAGIDATDGDCFGSYGSGGNLAFANEADLLSYMLGVGA